MEILEKISPYNLFNYFLPGIIFSAAAKHLFNLNLAGDDILQSIFIYYVTGMVISRVGSVIIEPFLRKVNFVVFADYSEFLTAEKQDGKIAELLSVTNMYRSLLSMFLCLAFVPVITYLKQRFQITDDSAAIIGILILALLFAHAYRKQVSYIRKRVQKHTSTKT